MDVKVLYRCTWVLAALVGHLASAAIVGPSADAPARGRGAAKSDDADLHVYVYHPAGRRLSLITVGADRRPDDAVAVDTNSASPLSPTAAFMWLSPQLERHLTPSDVAHLLASLRQNDVAVPWEAPSTCTPDACLTFLVATLHRAVPGNPLAMNALLDVLSDTLGKNPLDKVPEMVRWAGVLVGSATRGPVGALSTSTLLTAFREGGHAEATARTFWAMLVGCPAIQEHQARAKARAEALASCLGRKADLTPMVSEPSGQGDEFQLVRFFLAMLSAMLPS